MSTWDKFRKLLRVTIQIFLIYYVVELRQADWDLVLLIFDFDLFHYELYYCYASWMLINGVKVRSGKGRAWGLIKLRLFLVFNYGEGIDR